MTISCCNRELNTSRSSVTIFLGLLVLALAGCGGIPFISGEPTPTITPAPQGQEPQPTQTIAATDELNLNDSPQQQGGIDVFGRAYSGDVRAKSEVPVVSKGNGQIEAIHVDIGDTVDAGDVLVELEHDVLDAQIEQARAGVSAAEAGVAQAEAAIASARAQLAQAQEGPKASEREAARQGLEAAQAALERLHNSPTEADLIPIRAQYKQAEAAVEQAQKAYDQIKWRDDAGSFPQALQLEQATIQFESTKSQYEEALDGPEESQIKQAEAQLAEAQANWERVQEGTPEEQIAAAEAGVEQARAGLAAARAQLEQAQSALRLTQLQRDNAIIKAPIAGQIANVTAEIGQLASPQSPQPLMQIVSAEVEVVFEIDETLIDDVAAGDSVEIMPDALPDQTIQGTITRVSPVINPQTRTVTVVAEPNRQDGTLRSGMSVTVTLVE